MIASAALQEWRSTRTARINELFAAHRRVGGTGAGRRYGTEQLNWALVLRLAAEFQGFARDLHDETVDFFTPRTQRVNPGLSVIVTTLLANDRQLDKGNANPSNLVKDFGRMGMQLWSDLRAHSARAGQWESTLIAMNKARNAIAHHDEPKFGEPRVTVSVPLFGSDGDVIEGNLVTLPLDAVHRL